jgi:hypothetical protein
MLLPVMDAIGSGLAIKEANLRQCLHKHVRLADPIDGKLNIFVRESGKVAVRLIGPCPKD